MIELRARERPGRLRKRGRARGAAAKAYRMIAVRTYGEGISRVTVLTNARIVLGVTGGIAAYKAADLASKLTQAGALVDVIMTDAARRFVAPLTFQALTHRKVRTDLYDDWLGDDTGHVGLAHNADLLVIAPATAHTVARLALGLSDDLLSAIYLSTRAPVLIVPAMESGMYLHPATQQHLETLQSRGAQIM